MISIRTATPEDSKILAEAEWKTALIPGLLVQTPGEIPASAYEKTINELQSLGCYWVAEEEHDGKSSIVGHALLDPVGMNNLNHIFRLTIVVHPGRTHQGIGTQLMTNLMAWARQHESLQKIELLVRSSNQPAIHLYQKFGFVLEGTFKKRVRISETEFVDDLAMAWMK